MGPPPGPADPQAESRAEARSEPATRFESHYDFDFDDYQRRACQALDEGRGVLVAAPTGAGKTVVGEYAAHLAVLSGTKCFYTTPVKALSNQKFLDLRDRHGSDVVGLLTGDSSINSEAPVVVMTTEVLRNMLYAGSSTLEGLEFVVMDEVHYLADRERGAVWEEVLINLPESVQVASLSATVSNAEEFGAWLDEVRGLTDVIISEQRPVPLWQQVMVGTKLHDLFVDEARQRVNPRLTQLERREQQQARSGHGRRGRSRGRPSVSRPSRIEVVDALDRAGLLPAITFIFSRAGCEAAVEQCRQSGLSLTSRFERALIAEMVEDRCGHIPERDRAVLGFDTWRRALEHGIAAHHAGMLPAFKETVEQAFAAGLVKIVFATETLALGINMPARSVVLERLVKWDGQAHASITPAEYTQLTGRAGRRGIDVEGHGVVLWQRGMDPSTLAGLAGARTYPLRSSFRPSYNMAVNLVRRVGRVKARELLESSFAQFQADRSVVDLVSRMRRNTEAIQGYREAMHCDRGDFAQYAGLRARLTALQREQARGSAAGGEVETSLQRLRRGQVVLVSRGKFAGYGLVLEPPHSPGARQETPRPLVLTEGKQVRRLGPGDFDAPVEPLLTLRLPRAFNAKVASDRKQQVARMHAALERKGAPPAAHARRELRRRTRSPGSREVESLRDQLRSHPCHDCPEREHHARWAERLARLERESAGLDRRVRGRANTLARQLDRVVGVLEALGYLSGDHATDTGEVLSGIYGELDLLTAQCISDGVWAGMQPEALAACVSLLTFTSRGEEQPAPRAPAGPTRDAAERMQEIYFELKALESDFDLDLLRAPDPGFVPACLSWANGADLATVLREAELQAGDFVRAVKQVVDALDQIASVCDDPDLRTTARSAINILRRGVVGYSAVDGSAVSAP